MDFGLKKFWMKIRGNTTEEINEQDVREEDLKAQTTITAGMAKHSAPSQPISIGIRFDISKVDDSDCGYGDACWRIFWQAVDIKILAGAILREGDSNATPELENVYCISITWPTSGRATDVRKVLEEFELYRKVAANPNFIDGGQLEKESLVEDGMIDLTGRFVGKSHRVLKAFEKVQKDKQKGAQQTEQTNCPKCGEAIVVLPKRSSVSAYIRDYACTACSWSAPKCGNSRCLGYMSGMATPVGYQWKCDLCGWSGIGGAFTSQR